VVFGIGREASTRNLTTICQDIDCNAPDSKVYPKFVIVKNLKEHKKLYDNLDTSQLIKDINVSNYVCFSKYRKKHGIFSPAGILMRIVIVRQTASNYVITNRYTNKDTSMCNKYNHNL